MYTGYLNQFNISQYPLDISLKSLYSLNIENNNSQVKKAVWTPDTPDILYLRIIQDNQLTPYSKNLWLSTPIIVMLSLHC